MKEFFSNKIVMIVESVLLVAGTVGLTLAGVNAEGIQQVGSLSIAAVSAIDALITFITAIVSKDKKD